MRARARISASRFFCCVHRKTKKVQREFSNRKSSADSRQTLRSRTAASIARLIPGFLLTVQRDTPSSSAISWKLDAPRAMAITAKATRVSSDGFAVLLFLRHSIAEAMRSVLRAILFSSLMTSVMSFDIDHLIEFSSFRSDSQRSCTANAFQSVPGFAVASCRTMTATRKRFCPCKLWLLR